VFRIKIISVHVTSVKILNVIDLSCDADRTGKCWIERSLRRRRR